MNRFRLLLGFLLCLSTISGVRAQDAHTRTYTIFKTLELSTSPGNNGFTAELGQKRSWIQVGLADENTYTVKVYSNIIKNSGDDQNTLLLQFSSKDKDYTSDANTAAVRASLGVQKWDDANESNAVYLQNLYDNLSVKINERNSLSENTVKTGLPVRIELTVSNSTTVPDMKPIEIKVPYMPMYRSENEYPHVSALDRTHAENRLFPNWLRFRDFLPPADINYVGMKRLFVSDIRLIGERLRRVADQELRKLHLKSIDLIPEELKRTETHIANLEKLIASEERKNTSAFQLDKYRKQLSRLKSEKEVLEIAQKKVNTERSKLEKDNNGDLFGSSSLHFTSYTASSIFAVVDNFSKELSHEKKLNNNLSSQDQEILNDLYFMEKQDKTPQEYAARLKLIMSGEAANDNDRATSINQLSAVIAQNQFLDTFLHGEIYVPIEGYSGQRFFSTDEQKIVVLATSEDRVKSSFSSNNPNATITVKPMSQVHDAWGFVSPSVAPVFQAKNTAGTVTKNYSPYYVTISEKGRLFANVTEEGPFPVANSFDPSPDVNELSKLLYDGPTQEKSDLIGVHRGTFRAPGIPENSPWAWEKAIYDARIGQYTLDVIEFDAKSTSADNEILVTHDNEPYRVVSMFPENDPRLTTPLNFKDFNYNSQTDYTGSNQPEVFKPMKEYPLKDYFGKPMPHTRGLKLKEALEYFKCRQSYSACKCMENVGYLPRKGSAAYIDRFKEPEYQDKKWIESNSAPVKVLLCMDKVTNHDFKDSPNIIRAFKTMLETEMEDYIFFSSQIISRDWLKKNPTYLGEQSIINQIFYSIVYHDDYDPESNTTAALKGKPDPTQDNRYKDMQRFIDYSQRADPYYQWHAMGCQPQIFYPPPYSKDPRKGGINVLRAIARLSYKSKLWVEIFGASPLSPEGMSISPGVNYADRWNPNPAPAFDWRSMPEYSWSELNNLWVTDAPGVVHGFLEATKTAGQIRGADGLDNDRKGLVVPVGSDGWGKLPSEIHEKLHFLYFKTETGFIGMNGENQNAYFSGVSSHSGTKKIVGLDLSKSKHNTMFQSDFFGLKKPTHFTVSMWFYYDGVHQSFRLLGATDKDNKQVFDIQFVDGDLYWGRNTSNATTKDDPKFGNYWYNVGQGCSLDAGKGWYFVLVTMSPNSTRIALGKPKAPSYIGRDYGADYNRNVTDPNKIRPINGPGTNTDIQVFYSFMGTSMQGFDLVTNSFWTLHNDNPKWSGKVSDFQVSNVSIPLTNIYDLFNSTKANYRDAKLQAGIKKKPISIPSTRPKPNKP